MLFAHVQELSKRSAEKLAAAAKLVQQVSCKTASGRQLVKHDHAFFRVGAAARGTHGSSHVPRAQRCASKKWWPCRAILFW